MKNNCQATRFEVYTPAGTIVVEATADEWRPVRWSDSLTEERASEAVRAFREEYGEEMAAAPVVKAQP